MIKMEKEKEELDESMKACATCVSATGSEHSIKCTNPDSKFYYKNDFKGILTSHSGCEEWERNPESWAEIRIVCPECGEVIKKVLS